MIYNTTLCRTNDNTAHEFAMLKVLVAMLNNPELTPEESRKIYNDFYDPMFAILKGEGQE